MLRYIFVMDRSIQSSVEFSGPISGPDGPGFAAKQVPSICGICVCKILEIESKVFVWPPVFIIYTENQKKSRIQEIEIQAYDNTIRTPFIVLNRRLRVSSTGPLNSVILRRPPSVEQERRLNHLKYYNRLRSFRSNFF